jgi:ribosomal protein S18 acetylase RimI-like enzyme
VRFKRRLSADADDHIRKDARRFNVDHSPELPAIMIRRATPADLPSIVRLLADDPLGSQRESYREPLPQAYYDAFAAIDADPRHELVVVEQHGTVIGTLQLSFIPGLSFQGGTRAQIESVRIDRELRSQGIGSRLFQWAIERARERGCCLVQLTTNASRSHAQRFYERLGFVASHVGMKLDLQSPQQS